MTTTTASAALVPAAPVFTNTERLALAGFLAGYGGLTREAYELDLRQYASWCHHHHVRLCQARRADIECFAGDLKARGRARATVTRRLCTVAGFYRYAVEEDLLAHSPAAHVRRPRLDYESHARGLDRNELGALLAAAGLGPPRRARTHLPARPQRAARLRSHRRQHPSLGRRARASHPGHHPQGRQGGHHPARAAHGAGDRPGRWRAQRRTGLPERGWRLDRHGAARIVRRVARRAGITKPAGPHTLRHAFITAALDAGVPLRDVQEAASHADPRTTMRYDRARGSLDRHAAYIVAAYVAGAAR